MENSSSFTSSTSTVSTINVNNNARTGNTSEAASSTDISVALSATVLARALFDNNAEVAQELSFNRGDILTVIKRDPPGFEGWWICSLAGKVGIAPGNRLEILGSVKAKNRATANQAAVVPKIVTPTTVTAQVNPPDIDPYDELPTMLKIPPESVSPSSKMDQSLYANFYENYPPGRSLDSPNGSPPSRNLSPSPRPMSPKMEEVPFKSAPPTAPADVANTNPSTTSTTVSGTKTPHLAVDCNNKDLQVYKTSDSIPRRSVKRPALSSVAQTGKHSVRFVDPTPSDTDMSSRSGDSISTAVSAGDGENSTPLHRQATWSGHRSHSETTSDLQNAPSSPVDMGNGTLPNLLTVPHACKLTRSSSAPFSSRNSRPVTSLSSWQQTHSRIEMLIDEALAATQRFERGGSAQALLQKMRNFEQGLIAELSHLERLCGAFNCTDLSSNNFIQEERLKITREREGRLEQAFQLIKQPNPENGFRLMMSSLEQISMSVQAIVNSVQLNWFDCSDSEQSKRGGQMEDYFGSLSVSDREDSATTSLDSNDPTDLAGLLHVYAAQFQSHSILVRGTAEEFLGCLQSRVQESRNVRGYQLPTAGVLIANAKFLLRCSSQLVSLAANLSTALQNLPTSEIANSAADIEELRNGLETSGNAVCEALKGLIAQTKDVAGCLTSPSLNLPTTATTLASKPVVVLGPEMERLVGAVQDVMATTDGLRQTVVNSSALRNSVGSVER